MEIFQPRDLWRSYRAIIFILDHDLKKNKQLNFCICENAVYIRLHKFRVAWIKRREYFRTASGSWQSYAPHMCWHGWHTTLCCHLRRVNKTNYQSVSALLFASPERRVTNETTYSTWFSFITICYLCFRFCYLPPKNRLQKEPTSRILELCLWKKVLCGDRDWSPGFLCRSDIFSSRL